MKTAIKFVAVILLLAAVGCQKEAKRAPIRGAWKPTMENPPIRKYPICEKKDLSQMQDDDVIVAVNGVALTKGDLGLSLKRYWWDLSLNKMAKPEEISRKYRQYGRTYIDQFINTQLFLWEARKAKVLTASKLVAMVEEGVGLTAKKYRISKRSLANQVPGGLNGLKRSLEELCWVSAYIKSNVAARVTVTDNMVSNVIAQLDAENEAISKTNEIRRLKIISLYDRVVKKGEDFGKIVDSFGEEVPEKGKSGYWDSFQTAMDVPENIREKVFPLKKGEISEILEDDEGYYFIKVLDIRNIPQPTNLAEVVEYDLGRMFLPKEQYVVVAENMSIKKQMQNQFQAEANVERLAELRKKAEIIYPYGTNIWGKTKNEDKKGKGYRKVRRKARIVQKALKEGKDPKQALAEYEKSRALKRKASKKKHDTKSKSAIKKKKALEEAQIRIKEAK